MAGRRKLGESSEPSNVIISAVLILVPLLTDGDSDQIGNAQALPDGGNMPSTMSLLITWSALGALNLSPRRVP